MPSPAPYLIAHTPTLLHSPRKHSRLDEHTGKAGSPGRKVSGTQSRCSPDAAMLPASGPMATPSMTDIEATPARSMVSPPVSDGYSDIAWHIGDFTVKG